MKGTLTSIALLSFLSAFSQTKNDSLTFRNIADVTMGSGKAYSNLYELTKTIGHRLSGSTAYEKATDWAAQKLKEAGADKVWKQEVKAPVWTRGKESLQIQGKDGRWRSVKMLSLGNSEGTKGNDPLKEQNVPLSGLIPDPQRYFDLHHSESDTFEKVNRRELLLGAVTMAQIVYLIDKNC
ncbi:MAG TPA: hypothetical protein DD740_07685 [Chryseobacterium sp.]|nr:hypothetical protein [Chryseobacterium sp.]